MNIGLFDKDYKRARRELHAPFTYYYIINFYNQVNYNVFQASTTRESFIKCLLLLQLLAMQRLLGTTTPLAL